jgi:hypothetical protein
MANDMNTIFTEIKSYVAKNGGRYSEWYAGIAANAKKRLFSDHAVRESSDAWIFWPCGSSGVARDIENALFNLGMKGGPGGGDYSTDFVYAYKIAGHTVE